PAARAAYDRCEASLAQAGRPAPSAATLAMADAIGALGARLSELPRRLARGPRPPARDAARRVRLGVIAYRRIEADQTGALAAALAQEITIALAQFRWIDCIATIAVPESAGPGDILRRPPPGADFLLDGTIQCDGGRVRIIARLSDMRMGATVLWARRFDRTLADVFALQDEIAAETVAQMDAALLLWEGERAA